MNQAQHHSSQQKITIRYGKIPFGLVVDEEEDDGRKSPSSRFYSQSSPEEIEREIRSGKVRWPHRKFQDTAEMTLGAIFEVRPENRVSLAGLKRDTWLRQGAWAGGSTPSLTKKHLEKILVTADEVHDAVKSVPRKGEAIRHLDSVVLGDENTTASSTNTGSRVLDTVKEEGNVKEEDTKVRSVKIEMSSNVSSK